MKNVKKLLMFIIISTFLFASQQRVNALGGNVGYWADDDNSWTAFPHTINNSNLAQVSGIGSDGSHNAIVRWGDGTKWGFSWNQANANDMINLQWGNGSMGVTFGLNMSAFDNGLSGDDAYSTSGMGLSASWGMEMGFGELGVGFSNSSYDDGMTATKNDPASMGFWANLRRPQALWIFDNMLVSFNYGTYNTGTDYGHSDNCATLDCYDMAYDKGYENGVTSMDLSTSLYNHINIADNTTGLIAMGFSYSSQAGMIMDATAPVAAEVDNEYTAADETVDAVAYSAGTDAFKDYAETVIALPTWTFAVESAMTDWATARVGVNAGYNLMMSANSGVTDAKDVTGRGGMDTAFSVGLGFNYGSFNLDVDVSEGLFTNPVQHVTGYESIAPNDATATLTYSW